MLSREARVSPAPPPSRSHQEVTLNGSEPGSYRDRNGSVFYRDGRVYRAISAAALSNWERLERTKFFGSFTAAGRIVPTARAEAPPPVADRRWAAVLSHDRIPFVSYPYEWSFGMLKDAALLHLDLMQAALAEGMILKDSSAYNVQWRGVEPVFIDVPSFEVLRPGEPWVGYRQFCELFLYPLMLQAYKGVDFRPWLRGSLDGIPASALRPLLTARDLMRPGVLLHVVAQAALQRRYAGHGGVRGSLAEAGFDKRLIVRNVEGLQRIVDRMRVPDAPTAWANYAQTHSYEAADFDAKCSFVRQAAAQRRWRLAWDLGCNTGVFSRILAENADTVVAMDGDRAAVDSLYAAQKGRPDSRHILPLVVNLADPSPSQGWRGLERRSLPERGRPELAICLALIHHIVIGANIPLQDFIGLLADLGAALVIEFVGREDEMVGRLLADKDDQYPDYTLEGFEAALAARFQISGKQPLKQGKRWIYFAHPRD